MKRMSSKFPSICNFHHTASFGDPGYNLPGRGPDLGYLSFICIGECVGFGRYAKSGAARHQPDSLALLDCLLVAQRIQAQGGAERERYGHRATDGLGGIGDDSIWQKSKVAVRLGQIVGANCLSLSQRATASSAAS